MGFDPNVFFEALTSKALLDGAATTISLTIVSFAAGMVIGLIVALGRGSRFRFVRVVAWLYIWVFRAIPTLVQLFIVWFALPQLIPALAGPAFKPFYAAALALSFNEAAYAAEIIRGGLLAIDEGQRLAARALGMAPSSVFRRIVAPQLVRVIIPPTSNDFITMLKITSLAYVVSLREIMTNAQTEIAASFRYAEWYGAAAVYYLVMVSVFMVGQAWLERRYVWLSQPAGGRPRFPAFRGSAPAR